MRRLSIQVRLAMWYCASVAAIVSLFATGSWLALQASMFHSIDRDLGYRLRTVVPFIESHGLNSHEQFGRTFAMSSDASVVGVFIQITDDSGSLVYESDLLLSHRVPVLPAASGDGSVRMTTVGRNAWPVRVAGQHVSVNGVGLTVNVVEPLRDTVSSLREYTLYFALLVPLALLLTTTVGFWMSRRALSPVEQIRKAAEAIDPADLTSRIRVPESDDELARLAQTLNAMLTRIEAGFRSVEQFTADASHELRAPLALITTAVDISLRKDRPREEMEETLRKIAREARRMAKLVEQLLSLARADAQAMKIELVPVDLSGILSELCLEMTAAASAKGLRLESTLLDEPCIVSGDSGELRRLFLILIDNAIKYTESGSIHVTLSASQTKFSVIVCDTGIGIEEATQPFIFDRFWRADKVRSRSEGGAGLGLSIAAQIVKKHGGAISVASEIGRGTTFTVQFHKPDLR